MPHKINVFCGHALQLGWGALNFLLGRGCGEEALGGKKHEGDSARLLLACVFLTYVLCLLYVNKKKKDSCSILTQSTIVTSGFNAHIEFTAKVHGSEVLIILIEQIKLLQ